MQIKKSERESERERNAFAFKVIDVHSLDGCQQCDQLFEY